MARLWAMAVAIMSALASTLAEAQAPPQAAPEGRTLEHQGVARGYIVVNAAAARTGPRPLVLVLHGRRRPDEANRSSATLDALAARDGFVTVYPAAIAGAWNWPERSASPEIPMSMAGGSVADDLGFLTALIDRLVAERVADRTRIYVSGASMGGFMTFAMICTLSDRIAASAALLASMTARQVAACSPRRAVPVALLAGTVDKLVPFEGRDAPTGRLLSVTETLQFWWTVHGCTDHAASPVNKLPAAGHATAGNSGISTLRIDSTGCRIERAVRLYRVEGGGHTLPTLRPQSEDELSRFGPRSAEFETSEEIWSFVRRFRL